LSTNHAMNCMFCSRPGRRHGSRKLSLALIEAPFGD
jgi:hypothetical protein